MVRQITLHSVYDIAEITDSDPNLEDVPDCNLPFDPGPTPWPQGLYKRYFLMPAVMTVPLTLAYFGVL